MNLTLHVGRAADGRAKTRLVLLDQALVSGGNFLIGMLLARYLGPGGYGQFVLSYNIILFIAGIQGALVVSPMMVLGGARHGVQARTYFSAVLIYAIVVCVAFVLLMAAGLAVAIGIAPHWKLSRHTGNCRVSLYRSR